MAQVCRGWAKCMANHGKLPMMILDLKFFLGWYPWLSAPTFRSRDAMFFYWSCSNNPPFFASIQNDVFSLVIKVETSKKLCEVQPWTLLNLDTKMASFWTPWKDEFIRTVNNSPFSNRNHFDFDSHCHFWRNKQVAGHIRTYNAFSTPGILSHTKRIMGLETETVSLAPKKNNNLFLGI